MPSTVPRTPLPLRPILSVLVVLFANSMVMTLPFSFLPFLVRDFGYREEDVGYYSGFIASAMFFGRFVTSYAWGRLTDSMGRKAVIVYSTAGVAVATCVFGLSQNLAMAVVIRFICGTLGGQVPAVKTLMSEITDTSNQGVGMTLTALGWGAGLVIGPAIGGFLSQPADKYPLLDVWFFRRFPYSLPCLMVGVVTMGSVVCAACLLEETKVESRRTTAELDGSDIGSEEAGVKPPKDKSGEGMLALWAIREVKLVLTTYSLMSFGAIGFDEAFPLWCATSPALGGLGWTTNQIGSSMMGMGFCLLFVQMAAYAPLERRFGCKKLLQYSLLAGAGCVVVYPELTWLIPMVPNAPGNNESGLAVGVASAEASTSSVHASSWMMWGVIALSGFFRVVLGNSFTCISILINNSVASETRGRLNGMAMAATSSSRSFAPMLAGALFAWSIQGSHHIPLDRHLVFYGSAAFLVMGALLTNRLPDKLNSQHSKS